LLKIVNI